jgi:hypothetical protein
VALCGFISVSVFSFGSPGVLRSCFSLFQILLPVSIRVGLRCFWLIYDEQGHVVSLYSGRFNPIYHELIDQFKFRFLVKHPFLPQFLYFPEFGLTPGNDLLGIGSGFAKFNLDKFWERIIELW